MFCGRKYRASGKKVQEATAVDYLKTTLAVSRLYLDNIDPHPVELAHARNQSLPDWACNSGRPDDVGSILIEENRRLCRRP